MGIDLEKGSFDRYPEGSLLLVIRFKDFSDIFFFDTAAVDRAAVAEELEGRALPGL